LCEGDLAEGEKPDPDGLYWLQLVRWALESGSLKFDPEYQYPIESILDVLPRAKPQIAMKWFIMEQAGEKREEEYEEILVADPDNDWNPVELAERVIDHLDSCMSTTVDDYPRPLTSP
jgi:hypothetical protein